jgi:hypothetical protein
LQWPPCSHVSRARGAVWAVVEVHEEARATSMLRVSCGPDGSLWCARWRVPLAGRHRTSRAHAAVMERGRSWGGTPREMGPAPRCPPRAAVPLGRCLRVIHRAAETHGRPLVPQCARDGPVGTPSASHCRFGAMQHPPRAARSASSLSKQASRVPERRRLLVVHSARLTLDLRDACNDVEAEARQRGGRAPPWRVRHRPSSSRGLP